MYCWCVGEDMVMTSTFRSCFFFVSFSYFEIMSNRKLLSLAIWTDMCHNCRCVGKDMVMTSAFRYFFFCFFSRFEIKSNRKLLFRAKFEPTCAMHCPLSLCRCCQKECPFRICFSLSFYFIFFKSLKHLYKNVYLKSK